MFKIRRIHQFHRESAKIFHGQLDEECRSAEVLHCVSESNEL
jgi:hypothetical protein